MAIQLQMQVPQLPANNTLATMFGRVETYSNMFKLFENATGLTSNLLAHSQDAKPASELFGRLEGTFSLVRMGTRFADVMQDIRTPTGDANQNRMQWVQLVSNSISDLFTPVFFFEKQGFYTFDPETKSALNMVSGGFGLIGLATGVVEKAYELAHLDPQNPLTPIQKTNLALSIAEKVIDIAAIVLGFLSVLLPAVLLPIVAILGIAAAILAIVRLWRNAQMEELIDAGINAGMNAVMNPQMQQQLVGQQLGNAPLVQALQALPGMGLGRGPTQQLAF